MVFVRVDSIWVAAEGAAPPFRMNQLEQLSETGFFVREIDCWEFHVASHIGRSALPLHQVNAQTRAKGDALGKDF
jgi:hypothetical protein